MSFLLSIGLDQLAWYNKSLNTWFTSDMSAFLFFIVLDFEDGINWNSSSDKILLTREWKWFIPSDYKFLTIFAVFRKKKQFFSDSLWSWMIVLLLYPDSKQYKQSKCKTMNWESHCISFLWFERGSVNRLSCHWSYDYGRIFSPYMKTALKSLGYA